MPPTQAVVTTNALNEAVTIQAKTVSDAINATVRVNDRMCTMHGELEEERKKTKFWMHMATSQPSEHKNLFRYLFPDEELPPPRKLQRHCFRKYEEAVKSFEMDTHN